MEDCEVKGGAHITGGGLTENVPRMLPSGCGVRLDRGSWPQPEIFRALAREGACLRRICTAPSTWESGWSSSFPEIRRSRLCEPLRKRGSGLM